MQYIDPHLAGRDIKRKNGIEELLKTKKTPTTDYVKMVFEKLHETSALKQRVNEFVIGGGTVESVVTECLTTSVSEILRKLLAIQGVISEVEDVVDDDKSQALNCAIDTFARAVMIKINTAYENPSIIPKNIAETFQEHIIQNLIKTVIDISETIIDKINAEHYQNFFKDARAQLIKAGVDAYSKVMKELKKPANELNALIPYQTATEPEELAEESEQAGIAGNEIKDDAKLSHPINVAGKAETFLLGIKRSDVLAMQMTGIATGMLPASGTLPNEIKDDAKLSHPLNVAGKIDPFLLGIKRSDVLAMQMTGIATGMLPASGTLPNESKFKTMDLQMEIMQTVRETTYKPNVKASEIIKVPEPITMNYENLSPLPARFQLSSFKELAQQLSRPLSPSEIAYFEGRAGGCNNFKDSPSYMKSATTLETIRKTTMSIIQPEPIDMDFDFPNEEQKEPNLPHGPMHCHIHCPDGYCNFSMFVSDFPNHVTMDHVHVLYDRISPNQIYNFFVHPLINDKPKMIMLLLVKDKIKNFGSDPLYKDFLPMAIMSQRVTACEYSSRGIVRAKCKRLEDDYCVVVWATGLVPRNANTFVSLSTVTKNKMSPNILTNHIFDFRCEQNVFKVIESGQGLFFTSRDLKMLTNNFEELLSLRILIH